ncbi:MAG: hypothetical protein WDZ70_00540 [Candidatus Paceibacterota bacterium]
MNEPLAAFFFVVLIAILLLLVIRKSNVRSTKKTKPVANVLLSYTCHKKDFSSEGDLLRIAHWIKVYGLAIAVAEKISGKWVYYEDGTMRRGHEDGLLNWDASISIDEQWGDLYYLADILVRDKREFVRNIHIHIKDRGIRYLSHISSKELTTF